MFRIIIFLCSILFCADYNAMFANTSTVEHQNHSSIRETLHQLVGQLHAYNASIATPKERVFLQCFTRCFEEKPALSRCDSTIIDHKDLLTIDCLQECARDPYYTYFREQVRAFVPFVVSGLISIPLWIIYHYKKQQELERFFVI